MLELESSGRRKGVRAHAQVALVFCVASCELVAPIPDLTSGNGLAVDGGSADQRAPDVPGTTPNGTAEAGADASPDSSAPAACPTGALYCNPFESEATLFDFNVGNGTIRLDTSTVSSGASSLRVEASGSETLVARLVPPKPLPSTVFVRTMSKLEVDGTILFLGHGDFSDGVQIYIVGGQDAHIGKYNGGDDVKAVRRYDGTSWHCVELGLDAAGPTATMWIDDGPATTIAIAGAALPYEELVLDTAGNSGAWYDDLVVDTKRIGCP